METFAIPDTDLRVSQLCYGGGSWGTECKGEAMAKVINAFRDEGGNFFDTAHCYSFWTEGGDGASERALADYFRKNGGTKDCLIATKGGHKSEPNYRTVDHYLAPGRIAADIDDSLSRLGIDTIDFYWLHRDDTRLPVAEVIETMNAEIKRGRIRYLGASNWTMARIKEANAYARATGLHGFVATQPEWSLAEPNVDARAGTKMVFLNDDERRVCEAMEFPVVPYSPTAGGYFASDGQRAQRGMDNPTSRARMARSKELAAKLGVSANQIVIAYLTNRPFPVSPILGTTKLDHLKDSFAALDVKLSAEELRWLQHG
jgi:aryl-alcohol dehydrogenase-like predicted oxidoreductase